MTSHTIK